jgi:heme/copper-type cytochrome/quinol oxidase subunit 3
VLRGVPDSAGAAPGRRFVTCPLRGHFSSDSYWGIEGTVKYWHFVDLVWVFFYPALYLVS